MNLPWIKEINSEWKQLPLSEERYRSFGYLLSAVCIGLAIINRNSHLSYFGFAGLLALLISIISPRLFKTVYRYWMLLAISLGWIVSRVILTLIFLLAVTPLAIYLRIIKKDVLNIKKSNSVKSYWYHKDMVRQYTKMF